MVNELIVKKVLPSSRCEVCHQADVWDPEHNYCSRCQNTALELGAKIGHSQTQHSLALNDNNLIQVFLKNSEQERQEEIRWAVLGRIAKFARLGLVTLLVCYAMVMCLKVWIMTGQFPWEAFYPLITFLPFVFKSGKPENKQPTEVL